MESTKRTRISEAANPRKEKDANLYLCLLLKECVVKLGNLEMHTFSATPEMAINRQERTGFGRQAQVKEWEHEVENVQPSRIEVQMCLSSASAYSVDLGR